MAAGFALVLVAGNAHALNVEEEEVVTVEATSTYAASPMPDDYDPRQSAHPLRIVAYGVHPVGVALDWILVRPAVWVVRHEPFRTIFGYED